LIIFSSEKRRSWRSCCGRTCCPGAWIAPPPVRQPRAQLRHRASLVRLGTQPRNRIHAVAADHGYDRAGSYWTGPGRGWLAELDLPPVSRQIVTGCLASIDALAPVIERTRRRAAPAREGRPAGQGAADAAGGRRVHRAGHARRDR
jgi:hypothetical protein